MEYYRALSVQQPHAWAIINGYKIAENRSWATKYRGVLLIHSGKKVPRSFKIGKLPVPDKLPFGAIVGATILANCVDLTKLSPNETKTERLRRGYGFSKALSCQFAHGPTIFVMAHSIAFSRPIPVKGQMGLFTVPLHPEGLEQADEKKLQNLKKRFDDLVKSGKIT